MANDLYSNYSSEIQRSINDLKKNDNKGVKKTSLTSMSIGYVNDKEYKSNRIENIINRDIYQCFLSNGECSQYKDFIHFIQCFSKFLALKNYGSFLRENSKLFCSLLDEEKVDGFFNIKYIKNDLNVLILNKEVLERANSIPLERVVKKDEIKVTDIKLNKENYDNPFTEEEKFILMHYLFKHERLQEKKLSVYELTLILKISCDVFTSKKLEKIKDTVYEKYHNGYAYYSVSDREKKSRLKILIEKCKGFKLDKFAEYLNHEMFKTKFS